MLKLENEICILCRGWGWSPPGSDPTDKNNRIRIRSNFDRINPFILSFEIKVNLIEILTLYRKNIWIRPFSTYEHNWIRIRNPLVENAPRQNADKDRLPKICKTVFSRLPFQNFVNPNWRLRSHVYSSHGQHNKTQQKPPFGAEVRYTFRWSFFTIR